MDQLIHTWDLAVVTLGREPAPQEQLRDTGLLHMRVDAKRRLYRVDPQCLRQVQAALEELWDDRLDVLRTVAEATPRPVRRGRERSA
jgi:hypothetical protein